MLYPDELIEEIRLNNDIVEVVSEYVRLDRKGKDFFGLCPFHREKTPSFSVAPGKQIFYCFGCGKGGNVIQFIMNIENLDYPEALKYLADRARIQLPEYNGGKELEKARLRQELLAVNVEAARFFYETLVSLKGEAARKYLKDRGIREQTVKKFGLGFATSEWDTLYKYLSGKGHGDDVIIAAGLVLKGKNGRLYDRFRGRVMYPIFDLRGNVIAFGGRVMDSSLPKYMNSPETPVYNKGRNLYALNYAKTARTKTLLVVEGYMDVISLHQSGIINTVASLGTALTESQGRLLKKYAEEIIISYDADTAGEAATMRGLDLLSDLGCSVRVLEIPQGKDPDEYIKRNGVEEFRKLIDRSQALVEYKVSRLKGQIDTASTEGKIAFLNKAAAILARVENNLEREMYAKKLSKEYEISEEAIFSEIYKRVKPRTGVRQKQINMTSVGREAPKTAPRDDSKQVHDERFILALLCLDNSLFTIVREHMGVGDFSGPNMQAAELVYKKLTESRELQPAELMNMLDAGTAQDFSRIINEECHCEDNRKAILGKIKGIELYRAEKRQKEVLNLLKDENSLQERDVETLKAELGTLVLSIKKLKDAVINNQERRGRN